MANELNDKQAALERIKQKAKTIKLDIGKASIKEKDDLQQIKGIGPFCEEKLNALGIFTFRQIANFKDENIDPIGEAIEFPAGRIRGDEWVKQARIITGLETDGKGEIIERIKKGASKIDFKRIGSAKFADRIDLQEINGIGPFCEEKLNAAGIYKFEQIANFSDKDIDIIGEVIEFPAGRIRTDEWVKQARIITGLEKEGKKEVFARIQSNSSKVNFKRIGKATEKDKQDLKEIYGVGPYVEEKLNVMGVYTFKQIAQFSDDDIDTVAEVIEFPAARIRNEKWIRQARIKSGLEKETKEDVIQRMRFKSKGIDFSVIGYAGKDRDDLKEIKGIGPFIEEKLHALGIYTFEQVGKFNSDIEERVNIAIEFFRGRVKRDQWSKQAKVLHKNKVKNAKKEGK